MPKYWGNRGLEVENRTDRPIFVQLDMLSPIAYAYVPPGETKEVLDYGGLKPGSAWFTLLIRSAVPKRTIGRHGSPGKIKDFYTPGVWQMVGAPVTGTVVGVGLAAASNWSDKTQPLLTCPMGFQTKSISALIWMD